MNKPHKFAEVIKAWADGKHVQYLSETGWNDFPDCDMMVSGTGYSTALGFSLGYLSFDWRIKPELKTPGQVAYERAEALNGGGPWNSIPAHHKRYWEFAGEAVIAAYKAGELKDI